MVLSRFQIYSPSNRPEQFEQLKISLAGVPVEQILGGVGTSFASLCNTAYRTSSSEIVIIANDKARPTPADVERLVSLLDAGYGFVGLYRLGFFGCRRETMAALGYFDEGFVDGGFEDNDLLIRLKEADIATYYTEEIEYVSNLPSTWPQVSSRKYFFEKYKFYLSARVICIESESRIFDSSKIKFNAWAGSRLGRIPLTTYSAHFERILNESQIVSRGSTTHLGRILLVGVIKNIPRLLVPKLTARKHYKFKEQPK